MGTRTSAVLAQLDYWLRSRTDQGGSTRAMTIPPPDPIGARAVIDLATRVGEIALTTGASAADTTSLVLRTAYAYGVRPHVDVTYTAVAVSYTHPDDIDPVTRLRTVGALGMDYDTLTWLEARVDSMARGDLSITEARNLLLGQRRRRPRYRTWALLFAAAMQGAMLAILLGGGPGEALLAALGTGLVEAATRAMWRRGHPFFLRHLVAGAIPATIALTMMSTQHAVEALLWLSPSLVVATGMVTMLAGMGVVGAAQDALDGFFVTSAARTLDFTIKTGGLVLGVAGTLWLGVQLGVPAYLRPDWHAMPPPPVQVFAVWLFCTFFAVTTWLGPRASLVCGLLGAASWVIYLVAMAATGIHPLSAGLMAFSAAVVARLVSARLRVPVIALTTVAIGPAMPGLMLYRAVFPAVVSGTVVNPGDDPGLLLLTAILTGLGLALGASVGVMAGRRLAPAPGRIARLANARAWSRGNGRHNRGA